MNEQKPRRRSILKVALAVALVVLLLPLIYCCGIPLMTGQACFDILSGHVPPQAVNRFLDRVFEATVAEEYGWLATVSRPDALQQLNAVQGSITTGYEIILRDNMGGLYEYRIRFDNGATVYVTLWGEWETCPDFRVTEEEVFQYIELGSIRLESD